jgi:hypothetical protein
METLQSTSTHDRHVAAKATSQAHLPHRLLYFPFLVKPTSRAIATVWPST